MHKILIAILIIIILVMGFKYKYNNNEHFKNEHFKSESSDNMLYTAYNTTFVCSKWLDQLPKYMRLSRSGNPMYTSHTPPKEGNCWQVTCPPSIKDDITPSPAELDGRFDYTIYDDRHPKLTCWMCK